MISKIKLFIMFFIIALFCYDDYYRVIYVQAAEKGSFNNNELDFQYSEFQGTIEINKYIGNNEKVIIPSSINGMKVTSIGNNAFKDNNFVKEINISEGINSLGTSSFSNCNNLEKVYINNSVNIIGDCAFYGCSKLQSIRMPDEMTILGNNIFTKCESLETINIPKGVKTIGLEFAKDCFNLTKVSIPNSVTTICAGAFYGCFNLNSIEIPESVTSVQAPFQDLKQLTIIGKKGSATEKYANTLGFSFSESLDTVKVTSNEYNGFIYKKSNLGIEITGYKGSNKNIVIPDSINNNKVTSIGYECFKNNNSIEEVRLPRYLEIINHKAFYGCAKLQKITFNDNLLKIKDNAFSQCINLKDIEFPDKIQEIGEKIFEGCKNIKSISIPKSTQIISHTAFNNCPNLLKIDVHNENTYYSSSEGILYTSNYGGYRNLLKCPEGRHDDVVYIPDEVNYIRFYAFQNSKVKYISIKGKYINVQGLKETIIENLIKENKKHDIGDLQLIEVSTDFLLSMASSSDDSDIEMEISFNIYNTTEGKVVVIDNKKNTVDVKDIHKAISNPNDVKSVIDKEISIVNNNNNINNNNNSNYNNLYYSIKELSTNIIFKQVQDTNLPLENNIKQVHFIDDTEESNFIDNNSKSMEINDNEVEDEKSSNTKDLLSIISLFVVVTIIGVILLSITKYKKRYS